MVRSGSTDATVTLAPALRMTSIMVTASISSVPLPSGTRTVLAAEDAMTVVDRAQAALLRPNLNFGGTPLKAAALQYDSAR